jgi:hypothetical protein
MTLREIHTMLKEHYSALVRLHGRLPPRIGNDTAYSLGKLIADTHTAGSLVERDISMRLDECPGPNTAMIAQAAAPSSSTR